MKITVRVDASAQIGTGHFRRCLSLGHYLRRAGAEVTIVTRNLGLTEWISELCTIAGHRCIILPPELDGGWAENLPVPHAAWAEASWQQDVAQSCQSVRDSGGAVDWLIIDHYAYDARWHEAAHRLLGCRIGAIDDLADRSLACDLLVDHNWHENHCAKYAGLLSAHCKLFGGPHFALLGPAYAEAPRYIFNRNVRSIGIFMGGSDADNISLKALDAVDAAGFGGPVEIVSTRANPLLATLRDGCARRAGTTLTLDESNLAAFFARHDVQIGAGGGATWERLCIGAPSILVAFAENHLDVLRPLSDAQVAHIVDPDWTMPMLAEAIATLIAAPDVRRAYGLAGMAMVDGCGSSRVADKIAEQW